MPAGTVRAYIRFFRRRTDRSFPRGRMDSAGVLFLRRHNNNAPQQTNPDPFPNRSFHPCTSFGQAAAAGEDPDFTTSDDGLPHRCVEVVYMTTLLRDGYGFPENQRNVTYALEADGMEVGRKKRSSVLGASGTARRTIFVAWFFSCFFFLFCSVFVRVSRTPSREPPKHEQKKLVSCERGEKSSRDGGSFLVVELEQGTGRQRTAVVRKSCVTAQGRKRSAGSYGRCWPACARCVRSFSCARSSSACLVFLSPCLVLPDAAFFPSFFLLDVSSPPPPPARVDARVCSRRALPGAETSYGHGATGGGSAMRAHAPRRAWREWRGRRLHRRCRRRASQRPHLGGGGGGGCQLEGSLAGGLSCVSS